MKTIILIALLFAVAFSSDCVSNTITNGGTDAEGRACEADTQDVSGAKECHVAFHEATAACALSGCEAGNASTCGVGDLLPCVWDGSACAFGVCTAGKNCASCSVNAAAGDLGNDCTTVGGVKQGLECLWTVGNNAVADVWPCAKQTCGEGHCIACGPLAGADATATAAAKTACTALTQCTWDETTAGSETCTQKACTAADATASPAVVLSCDGCTTAQCTAGTFATACTSTAADATASPAVASACAAPAAAGGDAATTTGTTTTSAFVKGLPVLSMVILVICLLAEF